MLKGNHVQCEITEEVIEVQRARGFSCISASFSSVMENEHKQLENWAVWPTYLILVYVFRFLICQKQLDKTKNLIWLKKQNLGVLNILMHSVILTHKNPSFKNWPLFNFMSLRIACQITCYFINACYTFWLLLNIIIPKKI